jgi:hypothetical protein
LTLKNFLIGWDIKMRHRNIGIRRDRYNKLREIPTPERRKLIFQWIKTRQIDLKEFEFYCKECLLEGIDVEDL